jgi:Tol biopolymer transport system component
MKKILVTMLVMISLSTGIYIGAQNNAGALLQEARAMKAAGDLQGAMLGLERIVSEFAADRNAAANALLELGAITEQLGQNARARNFYERVKSQFQDQAAEVKIAETRLAPKTADATAPKAQGAESRITIKTPYTDDPYSFALSPDGKTLVIQVTSADGKKQLWRWPVDASKKGEPIPGTEGAAAGAFPFFSPDGQSIGYFANQKLWRIDLAGGKATELASASTPGGAAWGKNDVIVFGGLPFGQPMQKVEAGRVSAVTASTQWYVAPTFIEDERFIFFARDGRGGGQLQIGSIQGTSTLGARGGIPVAQAGAFTSGYLVFVNQGQLLAQKFDEKALTTNGTRIPISESVGRDPALPGKTTVAVSTGGAIAYRENNSSARQLKWIDRTGKQVGNPGPIDSASPQVPRISPDGRSVLFTRQAGRGNSIWVMDVETGSTRGMRETSQRAAWSPDGRRIIFSGTSPRGASPTLVDQQLPSGPATFPLPTVLAFPSDVGTNGAILYTTAMGAGDVFALPVGSQTPVAVANSTAAERGGRFSPNGAWIAYQSDESGRPEIYVQPFPGTSADRQRVSLNGGINPEWDPKQKAIYFLSPDNHLMMATAEPTPDNKTIEFSTPKPVFEKALMAGTDYAVAPDGQRFFVIEPVEDSPPITVLTNWAK